MALKDFLTYKKSYYHSGLSDNKQKYFMDAIYNGLEIALKELEIIIHKQEDLEKEVKKIKLKLSII